MYKKNNSWYKHRVYENYELLFGHWCSKYFFFITTRTCYILSVNYRIAHAPLNKLIF